MCHLGLPCRCPDPLRPLPGEARVWKRRAMNLRQYLGGAASHRVASPPHRVLFGALLSLLAACEPIASGNATRSGAASMGDGVAQAAVDTAPAQPVPHGMNVPSYQNPILSGTNPDPSICRVGDDYYLVTSSFEYFPGVPIYHSKDLVHWRQIGHALTRESQLPLSQAESSKGIFAPTIRHHDGTFYVITTNMEGGGSFYVTATDPAGPWSDPIWIQESVFTMDPSLFFDDDGKVYYTRHGEGQNGAVFQAEIDVSTGHLKDVPRRTWEGTGDIWPEGPHLYKRAGWYYLLISEGGTSYGHKITMARSRSPWGPFESHPDNPILTHKHLPKHPIQATGHADLVQTQEGQWWMVLLGIRPSAPGYHHIGRETFLSPVRWDSEGWLSVNDGRPIELEMSIASLPAPHPWPEQPAREEFERESLGYEWNYVRNPLLANYSLTERPGFLRLRGTDISLDDAASPTAVVQRQRHHRVRVTTEIHFSPKAGQRAGLVVRGNEQNHHQLLLEMSQVNGKLGRSVVLHSRIGGTSRRVAEHVVGEGPLVLGIEGFAERYEFFAETSDGQRLDLGSGPTAAFAYERTQSFTGAFIGLHAHTQNGPEPAVADFAWFEYQAR